MFKREGKGHRTLSWDTLTLWRRGNIKIGDQLGVFNYHIDRINTEGTWKAMLFALSLTTCTLRGDKVFMVVF